MIIQRNDGGKKTSKHPNEVRDCTVRALAIAFDISYDKAHATLKKLGRKDKRGFNLWYLFKDGKFNRKKIERLSIRRMSVKTFLEWNTTPDGTYVVSINGHSFAIKERVVHDSYRFSENCIVKTAYKIGK